MSFKHHLVKSRLLFSRGNAFVGTLGVGYLTTCKIHDQCLARHWDVPFFLIAAAGMMITWGLGWLEYRLGFWRMEAEILWEINPAQKRLTDALTTTPNRTPP